MGVRFWLGMMRIKNLIRNKCMGKGTRSKGEKVHWVLTPCHMTAVEDAFQHLPTEGIGQPGLSSPDSVAGEA